MACRDRWLVCGRNVTSACAVVAGLGMLAGACVLWTDHRERADATARPGPASTGGEAGAGGAAMGGQGGAGAAAGAGGIGGSGGGGGIGPTGCMSSTEHSHVFDLGTSALCLVAKYDAPVEVGYAVSPTWGRHQGPLTASYEPPPTDEAALTRWQVPQAQTGELTAASTTMGLGVTASTVYFGAQALDLPFGSWTLVSWTGDWGSTDGEAILVSDQGVAARAAVVGLFAAGGLAGAETNRLLFTALASYGDTTSAPVPGLYSADFCPGPEPCGTSLVAAWGEANGPIALDAEGNAFVVQTSFTTQDQVIRGFPSETVAPGAAATEGEALLTLPGFGSELAAMGERGGTPGLLFFQPYDSTSFQAGDVVMLPYVVSNGAISTAGAAVPACTMALPGTEASLMTDDAGRLWLGIVSEPGRTTFYVLDHPSS